MKLSLNGIKDAAAWKAAGISLPSYDVEKIAADTRKDLPACRCTQQNTHI